VDEEKTVCKKKEKKKAFGGAACVQSQKETQ